MKEAKYYVGLKGRKREVFKSIETPIYATHGHLYGASIGPFYTKRGAEYMAKHPHCVDVRTAEQTAKRIAQEASK